MHASRAVLGRIATETLLAAGLVGTIYAGTYWTATALQAGIAGESRSTLEAKHLAATVMMSGRDAYVWAKTPTERADAIAALRTVPGVRVVLVGEGDPPVRGSVVTTAPQPAPRGLDSARVAPASTALSVPPTATATRSAASTPPGRTSTTHGPSITMTKEG